MSERFMAGRIGRSRAWIGTGTDAWQIACGERSAHAVSGKSGKSGKSGRALACKSQIVARHLIPFSVGRNAIASPLVP